MSIDNLDKTDQYILNLLQQDGLMTYKEVAGKVKKSMSNVVERINGLKKNGYIKKTVCLVDINKIKSVFIAFPHVQLSNHSEDTIRDFQEQMSAFSEVMECYHLTGHFDFMIKIAVSDMLAYNSFMRNKLAKLSYIANVQSFLVLSASKQETSYLI